MDVIEILKNILPTIVMVLVAYFKQEGRINKLEIRLDNKKIRLDKLESQHEAGVNNFQNLIRSIDKLNNNFENLEKRLDKSETK